MKCIFCKLDTSDAEPVEHILPESLGNERHVLRRGVVCGKCNNYFASKVEKPFLEMPGIAALRFHQAVPSKKGRIPIMQAILQPENAVVEMIRDRDGQTSVLVPEEHFDAVKTESMGRIYLLGVNLIEPCITASRFLAKVALEALAQRIEDNDEWIREVCEKKELDPIRSHARFGETPVWPVSIRRIYADSTLWSDDENESYQLVHEYDFLYTEKNELFFVLAIFGQEFVINMGGPDLDGWHGWLKENGDASPLHHGKNAGSQKRL